MFKPNKKKTSAILLALAISSQVASANVTYTAQKGDSYWTVSQKFNTSLSSVLSANNATESSQLQIGQKVKVPSSIYIAQKGDSYYLIAKKCGVSLTSLLSENNATESSVLNIGDKVKIPSAESGFTYHTVKKGETYWIISQNYKVNLSDLLKANNAESNSNLDIGDVVKVPTTASGGGGSGNTSSGSNSNTGTGNYISYTTYTVQSGDTYWTIALKFGIPMNELLAANSLSESSVIKAGQKLSIPVHHIAVKPTPSSEYGELLDWFTEAQYVIPINADFTIVDFETGKSFNARRTVGSGHADCEPLTAADTAIMKSIWGGNFNWNKRSVLVLYNGRKIAASAAGMLHAGNEGAPGGSWTSWRSDNYGAGTNYDYVKGNDAHGHFDLYFYNSIGHSSGSLNSKHQANILKSAGK